MTEPSTDQLVAACREELDALWSDLLRAVRSAINTTWSMECAWLEARIKRLTSLVGPTPWEQVAIDLLESGVYQRIHSELGLEVAVDMERVAGVRRRIEARR